MKMKMQKTAMHNKALPYKFRLGCIFQLTDRFLSLSLSLSLSPFQGPVVRIGLVVMIMRAEETFENSK